MLIINFHFGFTTTRYCMKKDNKLQISLLAMLVTIAAHGQTANGNDTTQVSSKEAKLKEVTITSRKPGTLRLSGAENGIRITGAELKKAACCNLGESFSTNPSVDVAYADAATGAKQIKLLGLSGSYVQMMADNIPDYRGLAAPYSLGYVPGTWMSGIQVSKGASSVKNGYESITGQINVGFLDCKGIDRVDAQLYANNDQRIEANADASVHLSEGLSTGLLLHYEDRLKDMDDNDDGFMDDPNVRQYNLMNRWAYTSKHYLMHAMLSGLKESRNGGQMSHGNQHPSPITHHLSPYLISTETDRYEMYLKNAYLVGNEHNTNVALMLHGSFHRQNSEYGIKRYDAIQRTAYASLIFEHDFDEHHSLSSGLSFVRDYYNQRLDGESTVNCGTESESVSGAYAQYTLNLHQKLIAMVGLRADISSEYDGFVTPRTHIKWAPNKNIALRVSAGKGYRNSHVMAENNYLLTCGRTLYIDGNLKQEEAWNYGVSGMLRFPVFGRGVTLNAEYYRTQFDNQTVIDYDSNPGVISIHNLNGGKSYSNTFQVDATCMVFEGMTLTAAYRLNDVKCTYGNAGLLSKPLTSKYKGLVSASYKTPLGLWQFDATLQLNGGGRIPAHYDSGNLVKESRFRPYEQLQAQITREFRHFSVYVGAENLTAFRQKNPLVNAENPWDASFDPTLVWGPVKGRMFYVGVRMNFEKVEKIICD